MLTLCCAVLTTVSCCPALGLLLQSQVESPYHAVMNCYALLPNPVWWFKALCGKAIWLLNFTTSCPCQWLFSYTLQFMYTLLCLQFMYTRCLYSSHTRMSAFRAYPNICIQHMPECLNLTHTRMSAFRAYQNIGHYADSAPPVCWTRRQQWHSRHSRHSRHSSTLVRRFSNRGSVVRISGGSPGPRFSLSLSEMPYRV